MANTPEVPNEILGSEEKATTFDEGNKVLQGLVSVAGACISLFIIATMLHFPLPAMIQRAAVLMLSLFVIFMTYPLFPKTKSLAWVDWLWAGLAIVVCGYVVWDFEDLVNRMGDLTMLDQVLAGLCVVMVLDATRRAIGWPLPIVTSLFLLYAYFGNLIPGSFSHRGYDIHRILNQMYVTTEGIFGIPIGVVVTIVFLFILFGAFLEKGGGGSFFINLAVSLAGRLKGGPAKIAVISSGLMGMISGSSIANVATTGTFTIPLMKRCGYRPEFAGAVEAAASTGGQIMPPVLGAAAFIMSEFTNTPYLTIVIMTIVPAFLYYLSVYMNVHFEACRTGLQGMPEEEIPKTMAVLRDGWIFIVPVIVLVVVLTMGYSPARAAFSGMGILLVVGLFKASTRIGPKAFWEVLVAAGRNTVGIAAACACAGIIVGTVSMTGLGIKFATLIEHARPGTPHLRPHFHGNRLADPRHGPADDGQLHRPGLRGGAGTGGPGDARAPGPPVRLLLRRLRRHHAARWPWRPIRRRESPRGTPWRRAGSPPETSSWASSSPSSSSTIPGWSSRGPGRKSP